MQKPTTTEIVQKSRPLYAAGGFLLDLLFPRRCPWCGRVVGFAVCCVCTPQLLVARRGDSVGGTAVSEMEHALSHLGADGDTKTVAPFFYSSPVKEAIWAMKFDGMLQFVQPYAREMADALCAAGQADAYNLIVPVPTTQAEHRHRDDLPQALARALGEALRVPVRDDLLVKTRETVRQMSLSGAARRKNLLDAFSAVQPQAIAGQSILLVDDVLTTGSTLNECAKALRNAGALVCGAVCIAVTQPEQKISMRFNCATRYPTRR